MVSRVTAWAVAVWLLQAALPAIAAPQAPLAPAPTPDAAQGEAAGPWVAPRVQATEELHTLLRQPIYGGSVGDSAPVLVRAHALGQDLGVRGLSAELSLWGLVEGVAVDGDDRLRGALEVGLLRYRSPAAGPLELRLGRQLLPHGAYRVASMDGGLVRLGLPFGFGLTGWAGLPVTNEQDPEPRRVLGARLEAAGLRRLRVNAGFGYEERDSGYRRPEATAAALLTLPLGASLQARAGYDLELERPIELDTLASVDLPAGLRVEGRYRRSDPARGLPPESLLAIFVPEDSQSVGGAVQWRGVLLQRSTVVHAGGGASQAGGLGWEPTAELRVLVDLEPGARDVPPGWEGRRGRWVLLELRRAAAPLGVATYGRAALGFGLSPTLRIGGELRGALVERDYGGRSLVGGMGAYSQWRPLGDQPLSVLANVGVALPEQGSLPDGVLALLRLVWEQQLSGAGASAGQGAPLAAAAGPDVDSLRMNHRAHAEQSVGCLECHAGADAWAAGGRSLLPAVGVCQDCHEVDHSSLAELPAEPVARKAALDEMEDCSRCHTQPDRASASSLVAEDRALRFDHGPHAAEGDAACPRCHAGAATSKQASDRLMPTMESCRDCHQPAFARSDCGFCHSGLGQRDLRPVASFSHDGDFLHTHGMQASTGEARCSSCHDQRFCTTCHGADQPAAAGLLAPERSDRTFVHGGDFRWRHGVQASQDQALCLRCHGPQGCRECHERAGLAASLGGRGSPHPPGYVDPTSAGFHGHSARARIAECAGCHEAGSGTSCIGCHRVGGGLASPHPAGWADPTRSAQALTRRPCVYCHKSL